MLRLLLASCFLLSTAFSATPTCPFDSTVCECTPTKDSANSFNYISCQSSQLPSRTNVPSGQTYVVEFLTISSDHAYEIPSEYFSPFSSISHLILQQNITCGGDVPTCTPVPQQFAADAFDGVSVHSVIFQSLSNLLPIPDSLKPLGKLGLAELGVANHGPGRLVSNAFEAFPKLSNISITRANLTIDLNAFAGIARNLNMLYLADVGLTEFPSAVLSDMSALTVLSLESNRIASIPRGAFDKCLQLELLFLPFNPLGDAIEKGALDNLPENLTKVSLENVGLTKTPSTFFGTNPHLERVVMTANKITKIGGNDFLKSADLFVLNLDDNPIDTIENGAFQSLKSVRWVSLTNTSTSSMDFALFCGLAGDDSFELLVDLSQSSNLKSIDMTSKDNAPSTITVQIENSALETISSNFEVILQMPRVKMILSGNTNLKCGTLDWLAPYAVCSPDMITTSNSVCADVKMSLADYLQSKFKGPCPTRPTFTTGQSTQSTVSTKGVAQATATTCFVIALVAILGLIF